MSGAPTDFVTGFITLIVMVWFLIFSVWVLYKLGNIMELLQTIRKKIQ